MPDLLYEKFDNYAIFTMNRPERLNALGGSMREEMYEALVDFTADDEMRAGIVTGAGRSFSAGMDLKEAADRAATGQHIGGVNFDGTVMAQPLSSSPKPFIAAINGLAVGGGLERAIDCDIRICSTDSYLGLFEPRRGILPGPGVHMLPRLIGIPAASYVLLTADRITPEQALEWGIVSEIVEPDELMPRAIEIAQMIAENAPLSVQGTKAEVRFWNESHIEDSHLLYQWVAKQVFESEDAKEGPTAFAEKRDPVWTGR